jgi:hypothetical protein
VSRLRHESRENLTVAIVIQRSKGSTRKDDPSIRPDDAHIFDCRLKEYDDRRKQLQSDDDGPQEVLVLRGGFTEFQRKFKVVRAEILFAPFHFTETQLLP